MDGLFHETGVSDHLAPLLSFFDNKLVSALRGGVRDGFKTKLDEPLLNLRLFMMILSAAAVWVGTIFGVASV